MNKLQIRLLITGLAYILAGFLYGMFHTVSVDHAPRMSLKDDYQSAFSRLSESRLQGSARDSAMLEIDAVGNKSTSYQRAIGAHTHAIYLGMLVIVIALLFSQILADSRHAVIIAGALGSGILIYPAGLAVQAAGYILPGEAIALLGSLLVVSSMTMLVWKSFFNRQD